MSAAAIPEAAAESDWVVGGATALCAATGVANRRKRETASSKKAHNLKIRFLYEVFIVRFQVFWIRHGRAINRQTYRHGPPFGTSTPCYPLIQQTCASAVGPQTLRGSKTVDFLLRPQHDIARAAAPR